MKSEVVVNPKTELEVTFPLIAKNSVNHAVVLMYKKGSEIKGIVLVASDDDFEEEEDEDSMVIAERLDDIRDLKTNRWQILPEVTIAFKM